MLTALEDSDNNEKNDIGNVVSEESDMLSLEEKNEIDIPEENTDCDELLEQDEASEFYCEESLSGFSNHQYGGEWKRIDYDGIVLDSFTFSSGYTLPAYYRMYNDATDDFYACYALVDRYYQHEYNIYVSNMWGPGYTPMDSTKGIAFVETQNPVPGDIMRVNEEAHWAIVTKVNGNEVTIIQQNAKWDGKGAVGFKVNKNDSYATFFHYQGATTEPTYAAPSIESVNVSNIDKVNGTYDVTAVVKAEAGLDRVEFPTWSEANGQDDKVTKNGNNTDLGGNRYKSTFTVKISDHNNERGKYITDVWAFDKKGRNVSANAGSIDLTPPAWNVSDVYSEVTSVDLNQGTYTVTTSFKSDLDVTKVQFPTWSEANGQDDIANSWRTNSSCQGTLTKLSNGMYQAVHTERMAEHKNERGEYNTHVYVFDQFGREKKISELKQNLNNIRLTGIKLGDKLRICAPNQKYDVDIIFSPNNASDKIVKWTSNDSQVAYIERGKLVTKNEGTTILTGISEDGGFSVTLTVYVTNNAIAYDSSKEYGVAYILNGGINNNSNKNAYSKGSTLKLSAASRNGYSFLGWYDYFTDNKVTSISGKSAVVYAKWNINTYKLTYNLNGGAWPQGTIATASYTVESLNITLPTPAKQYYTFGGWYTDSSLTNGIDAINPLSARNYTLYAKWNPIVHSISYNMNDTSTDRAVPGKNHVVSFEEAKATTLINPTREGFTFEGYYKKDPNSMGFNAKSDRITVIPKGTTTDQTIYAKWKENGYKVIYNANGGKFVGTISPSSYKYTDNLNICSATAVMDRVGYAFKGWNTKSNGTGTHYQAGIRTSRLTKTNGATITLYAEWELLEYPIYYYLNGGEEPVNKNGEMLNPPTHNVLKAITLKNPTRTGYTFGGWFATSNFSGGKVTTIPKSDQEISLYAKWAENAYKLTYNANGGKFIGSIAPAKYRYTENVCLCSEGALQNRAGYEFTGWNTKNNGKGIHFDAGDLVTGISSKNDANVVLYAEWKLIEYPIEYNLNGGLQPTDKNGKSLNPETHNITKAVALKNPVKDGYTFKGWFATPDYSGGKITTIPKSNQNIVLYAKWEENTYKLSYNANGGRFIGTITPEKLKYTQSVQICSQGVLLNRNGYKFTGWNTKKDGKGIHYEAGTTASQLSKSNGANVVLYAEWKLIEYPITYILDGGKQPTDKNGNSVNPSSHTIAAAVSLKNPSKIGYKFGGWYATSDFTGGKISSIPKSDQPVTIYAKWTPIKYKVVFNANSGKGAMPSMTNCVYDVAYVLTPNSFSAPSVEKNYFYGWNTKKDGTGTNYADKASIRNLTSSDGTTVTLYAIWTSKWVLESEVPAGAQIIDNKWEYTEKEWITSNKNSANGYTLDSTRTVTSYGSWSSWTETPLTASETKEVKKETRSKSIVKYRLGYVSGLDGSTGFRWYYSSTDEFYKFFNGSPYNANENCYVELTADQVNALPKVQNNGGEGPYSGCRQFNGSDSNGYAYDGLILFNKSSYSTTQNYTVYASRDIIKTYYLYKNVDKESKTKVTAGSNISNVKHYVKYR